MDAETQEGKRQRRSIGTELAEARAEVARLRSDNEELSRKLAMVNADFGAAQALLEQVNRTVAAVIERLSAPF
jgi:chromosome segregation ATPase